MSEGFPVTVTNASCGCGGDMRIVKSDTYSVELICPKCEASVILWT